MTVQISEFSDITELVRGTEQQFLERLQPLARRQNLTLDLENIERVDAAGLAALVTLYCDASQAGRRFAISNPSPHVQEVLAIVGLQRILMAQPEPETSFENALLQETAA